MKHALCTITYPFQPQKLCQTQSQTISWAWILARDSLAFANPHAVPGQGREVFAMRMQFPPLGRLLLVLQDQTKLLKSANRSSLVYHQLLSLIFSGPEVKERCRAFSHGMRTQTLQVASRFPKGIQVKNPANLSPAASKHLQAKVRVAAEKCHSCQPDFLLPHSYP